MGAPALIKSPATVELRKGATAKPMTALVAPSANKSPHCTCFSLSIGCSVTPNEVFWVVQALHSGAEGGLSGVVQVTGALLLCV